MEDLRVGCLELLSLFGRSSPFGSWEVGKGKYCGRLLEQKDDYSNEIRMTPSVKKLNMLAISKERRQNPEALCTSEKLSELCSAVGLLDWKATEGRPDLSDAKSSHGCHADSNSVPPSSC